MEVKVRNLGVIKEAEIKLKPLTVFIGPNNAGKTWLADTLAAILGPNEWRRYTRAYILEDIQGVYPLLDSAVQQVLEEGNAKIDLVHFAEQYGEKYINNVARFAGHEMRQFMGTVRASFDNLEVHVSLAAIKEDFLRQVLAYAQDNKLSVSQRRGGPLLSVLKEMGKRELFIYTSTEGSITEKLPQRVVKELLATSVFQALHRAIYPTIYSFPIERTSYMIVGVINQFQRAVSDKGVIALAETLWQEQIIRPVPTPVGSFLEMMLTMFSISTMLDREDAAKNNSAIEKYIQLAKLLEETVLGGIVDFSTPEPDPQREILFKLSEDMAFELSIASSMVKELAPLVLYLRYLAQPGELLIIDEPEMNLHPAAQTQIIEFLAMLVNAGLHILITTHSTYVIDHLANLMDAYKHKNQDEIVEMFLLGQKEAFISQEKVSVYLVEDSKVKNILNPEGEIDWKTFSEVTALIGRIHFELLGE